MWKLGTRRRACMLILAGALMLGCGDSGPPGAMGEPGLQGEPGLEGEPGTANVLYSDWFSLGEAAEKSTVTIISGTTKALSYRFDDPALTADILETGTVQFYFGWEHDQGRTVVPFPVVSWGSVNMDVSGLSEGSFWIRIYRPGSTSVGDAILGEDVDAFRYVIVPAGLPL